MIYTTQTLSLATPPWASQPPFLKTAYAAGETQYWRLCASCPCFRHLEIRSSRREVVRWYRGRLEEWVQVDAAEGGGEQVRKMGRVAKERGCEGCRSVLTRWRGEGSVDHCGGGVEGC